MLLRVPMRPLHAAPVFMDHLDHLHMFPCTCFPTQLASHERARSAPKKHPNQLLHGRSTPTHTRQPQYIHNTCRPHVRTIRPRGNPTTPGGTAPTNSRQCITVRTLIPALPPLPVVQEAPGGSQGTSWESINIGIHRALPDRVVIVSWAFAQNRTPTQKHSHCLA